MTFLYFDMYIFDRDVRSRLFNYRKKGTLKDIRSGYFVRETGSFDSHAGNAVSR